jgi:hypothetical protein
MASYHKIRYKGLKLHYDCQAIPESSRGVHVPTVGIVRTRQAIYSVQTILGHTKKPDLDLLQYNLPIQFHPRGAGLRSKQTTKCLKASFLLVT